jgi:tetratricopeptide (TPR) repeat protein
LTFLPQLNRVKTVASSHCDSYAQTFSGWIRALAEILKVFVEPSKNGIIMGSALVACACFAYLLVGFQWIIWLQWLAGLSICGYALWPHRSRLPSGINLRDAITAGGLFLLSLPAFIGSIYTVPFQVGADEAAAVFTEQQWTADGVNDIFGLSGYYGFTYFHFMVQAWLSKLLGAVNLYHMRLVHGFDGSLITLAAFIFFRIIGMSWPLAVTATVVIACNHALIGISRIAFTINFSLLTELIALAFLFAGRKHNCVFLSYVGGICIGIGFYEYYPARVILPIWLLFLACSYLSDRSQANKQQLIKIAGAAALGLALAVAPLATAHIREPSKASDALDFQRHQCLLFPEGREMAKTWGGNTTVEMGVIHNIVNGLTAFNNNEQDRGYEYQNPGHGFVDPLCGVLLWIGFISVLIQMRRQMAARLMVSGFLLQVFSFSFLVTKAPNYTRLLVVLPFVGYFVAYGVDLFATMARNFYRQARRKRGQAAVAVIFLIGNLTIIAWNFEIFHQYSDYGAVHGDPIGGTARYIEARRHQKDHLFVTSASVDFPYYSWEVGSSWNSRVQPFLAPGQQCCVLGPGDITSVRIEPPFTIFMDGKLWSLKKNALRKMYPKLVEHKIFKDTGLIAVENPQVTAQTASTHQAYRQFALYPPKIEALLNAGNHRGAKSICQYLLKSPNALVCGSDYKAAILLYLGIAYSNLKEFPEAEQVLQQAMKLCIAQIGSQDVDTIRFDRALGELYFNWKRWADAEIWYGKIADTQESLQDAYDFSWVSVAAQARRLQAKSLWQVGKRDEAIAIFQRALDYYKRHPERDDPDRLTIVQELDACRNEKEQFSMVKDHLPGGAATAMVVKDEQVKEQKQEEQSSIQDVAQAQADFKKMTTTKGDDDLGRIYARLGLACLDRRNYLEAERAYHHAIAARVSTKKPDDEIAGLYGDLGYVYLQLDRFADAEDSYAKAEDLSSAASGNRQHFERDREFAHFCRQKAMQEAHK